MYVLCVTQKDNVEGGTVLVRRQLLPHYRTFGFDKYVTVVNSFKEKKETKASYTMKI